MQCISKFEQDSNLPSKNGGVLPTLVVSYIKQMMKGRSGVNETDADQRNARCSWDGPAGGPVSPDLDSAIHGALGAGRMLDHSMGWQLGIGERNDLGPVRVHTDSRADDLARALGAQAFTVGRDIFFSVGSWDPDSAAGRGLIAHELAHVSQQEAGRVPTNEGCLVVLPANALSSGRPNGRRPACPQVAGSTYPQPRPFTCGDLIRLSRSSAPPLLLRGMRPLPRSLLGSTDTLAICRRCTGHFATRVIRPLWPTPGLRPSPRASATVALRQPQICLPQCMSASPTPGTEIAFAARQIRSSLIGQRWRTPPLGMFCGWGIIARLRTAWCSSES